MQVGKMMKDDPLVFGAPGYVCPSPGLVEEVGFERYDASVKCTTMTRGEMLAFEGKVDALFGASGLKKNYIER